MCCKLFCRKPLQRPLSVMIKSPEEIAKMRIAGRLAASVLEMITPFVQPGVTTGELERICRRYIVEDLEAVPSTLGQQGFPACICTSVNHVVCHGIPHDRKPLQNRIINYPRNGNIPCWSRLTVMKF